jgi:hypothetical protein
MILFWRNVERIKREKKSVENQEIKLYAATKF